jgi:predicted transcriptional regulator
MPKKQRSDLGRRELDIVQALWRLGTATVAEVHAHLRDQGYDVAYTTVQTMLNRLHAKRFVARESSTRAHRYRAVLEEHAAVGGAIQNLSSRFFRGSKEALAIHLIEKTLTSEQLDRLQRAIDERRKEAKS